MKTFNVLTLPVTVATLALPAGCANDVAASDSPPPTSAFTAPGASGQKPAEPVQLSYGVEDILKVTRAKVSDDVMVPFIKNSGRLYQLTSSEIIYLHDEGMSDQVISAMLNQTRRLARATPQKPPQTGAASPALALADAPQYVTASAPTSSVYVIPSSAVYDCPYYPYYPYYGYGYPWISLGFGYWGWGYYGGGYYCGNGHYGGGYHGGYHGGGHPSGGHPGGGKPAGGSQGGSHPGSDWTGGGNPSGWSGGRQGSGGRSAGPGHSGFASGGGSSGGGGGHR
jgi:hypothetical protein